MADPSAFSSNQTALLEMGAQLAAVPGLMQSLVFTAAVMALIFVPFFTAYKAYFFKALIAAQAVVAAAQAAVKKTADDGSADVKAEGDENSAAAEKTPSFADIIHKEIPQEILQNQEKPHTTRMPEKTGNMMTRDAGLSISSRSLLRGYYLIPSLF